MAGVRSILDRHIVLVFGVGIRRHHLVVVGEGWWLARLVRCALSVVLSDSVASVLRDVSMVVGRVRPVLYCVGHLTSVKPDVGVRTVVVNCWMNGDAGSIVLPAGMGEVSVVLSRDGRAMASLTDGVAWKESMGRDSSRE